MFVFILNSGERFIGNFQEFMSRFKAQKGMSVKVYTIDGDFIATGKGKFRYGNG